jgi:hypothetical protein
MRTDDVNQCPTEEPRRPPVSVGDGIAAVLLLLGHAALMLVSFIMSFGIAMSTDVFAYQECGDEKWVGYAIAVALPLGMLVLLADLVATIGFWASRRRPWVPPLVGCCVQVGLLMVALVMPSMAGPVH